MSPHWGVTCYLESEHQTPEAARRPTDEGGRDAFTESASIMPPMRHNFGPIEDRRHREP
jgi:hypothetical protein